MDHRIAKFIKRGKDMATGANTISIPPSVRMHRIMDQIERIQKLGYLSDEDKNFGLDALWKYYHKVQKTISDKYYTGDESWNNAKKGNDGSPEVGIWSHKNNHEVDFQTYGDTFEDLIDSTLMPDGRTKPKTSEY